MRRWEENDGKTLNYPQMLFSLLIDWTRRECIYILNWSLSSLSDGRAVNGAIMHAWIRVTNTPCHSQKVLDALPWAMSDRRRRAHSARRFWQRDRCTLLTNNNPGVETKPRSALAARWDVIPPQSCRCESGDGTSCFCNASATNDKSRSKQRRRTFWFQRKKNIE